jgi:hypothetical protein
MSVPHHMTPVSNICNPRCHWYSRFSGLQNQLGLTSPCSIYEILRTILNPFFLTEASEELLFTASAFESLVLFSWSKCHWFLSLFLTTNLWSLPTWTAKWKWNVHECRFGLCLSPSVNLSHEIFLQYCKGGSRVSVKFIIRTIKNFKALCIIWHGIQPGSAKRNYWSWGNCVSGVLFLKNSILADNFTGFYSY